VYKTYYLPYCKPCLEFENYKLCKYYKPDDKGINLASMHTHNMESMEPAYVTWL